ncbi:MAG TPA: 2'-5' RNA ligase family protein [Nocardioidaceae bacterium]|nr:2'-5' RNA ligase family protein [Nocardioidaceae bacterium]
MSTVGVVIAVPEPWGSELQSARAALGDARAYDIPTHITLVPPTEVDADLDEVEAHLARVAAAHPNFAVLLRGTASFRPVSPVVFVEVAEGISRCELLAGEALGGPLAQRTQFPYHPHVTVAHGVPDGVLDKAAASLEDFSAGFDVTGFDLYALAGDGWRRRRSFQLTG